MADLSLAILGLKRAARRNVPSTVVTMDDSADSSRASPPRRRTVNTQSPPFDAPLSTRLKISIDDEDVSVVPSVDSSADRGDDKDRHYRGRLSQ